MEQFQRLKPSFIVRNPESYHKIFWFYMFIFFAAFYLVHIVWRTRGFAGDTTLLPMVHLLTGIGLMLMMSLRDPLRDMTLFSDFAQGTGLGCAIMLWTSLRDYQQPRLQRLSFVPLLASFFLSVVLILFGTGPGASDARVNLNLGFST